MKNKLSFFALHILLFLFIISGAHAQDIPAGYYRVMNVGLKSNGGKIYKNTVKEDCYAYVANGTYHVQTSAGAGQNIPSMLLWAGLDNAIVSPQTVVYIVKSGNNYNIEAQGTSLSQMTSYKIDVTQITSDTYTLSTTISGIKAYLEAQVQKSGIYDKEGNDAYPSNYIATTVPQGSDVYKRWQLLPISSSSDNYVAVNAFLQADGKYYAPYYASYPFKFVSPGMKAYYVNSISKSKYTLKEITSEVIPAKTPVIIECSSNNPANCKIEPLYGNYGSVSGNKLAGVYFCNLEMSQAEYPDCRKKFVSSSMRVWAVKNGQLVLTNNPDKSRLAIPYDDESGDAWLMANESYLTGVPSTAAADLLPAGAATTISFDSNGGTDVEPISGAEGDPVVAPANPTKTGYSFVGWNPALPSVFPAADMSVTAQWQINKYTITFDTDGGTAIAPITQEYQSAITAPANPTKEGSTFAGWDKEIPGIMPAEDVTIKALWTTNKYSITFETDGGTAIAPISQDYGTTITAPANPTKEGYTFAGWDQEIPTTMPAGNVTIKALWNINQYTITFDTDGGTIIEPITQDYGTAIVAPANPIKDGSVFAGWDKTIPGTMPAENITIKALWGKLYTLTFDTDGGSEISSITAVSGVSIEKPEDPTKTGYTFAGWIPSIPSVMPESDVTVKATWTINKHKVTFMNYDGSVWQEETLDYGAEIKLPATNPTKPGAVFKHWSPTPAATVPDEDVVYTATYDDSEYTITFDTDGGMPVPNSITDFYNEDITDRTKNIQTPQKEGYTFDHWEPTIPSVMTGDMTIKAIWKISQYTITFNTDGGSAVAPITKEYQSVITAPVPPVKEGYTFQGWNPALPEMMPLNGFSTTAQWQINKHTLTYYVDNVVYKTIEDVEYATPITPEAEPNKVGYTFSGWSTIPSTMPDNDVSVTGTFSINQYTITFDTDGGSEVASITQDYNSIIAAPASAPVKEGYTFIGWNPELPEKMPLDGFSTTAQWQINKHTLTYYVDGVEYKKLENVEYSTEITPEKEPEKEGYTFSGWSTIPSTMPDNNVNVTGTFTINQYTITFDSNGGSEVSSITQDYGTAITVEAPTRDGYDFAGWSPELPATMPAENMTLTAQWGPKTWEETYDFNEGWTWVSFTMINREMRDLDTVLSSPSLKWTSTDEIKGASVWGIYSAKKGKWVGELAGFNDVTMYKIHSSVAQQLTLEGSYQNSKGNMSLSVDKGWNYLAYLSLSELSVEEALKNYPASEGDVIKSLAPNASAQYTVDQNSGKGQWKGTLTTMEPRKGYMLKRIADNTVSFTYPIAAPAVSSEARASRLTGTSVQRFSSNMTVFATVDGVMSVPGDSVVAVAIDGVRGGATVDNEGRACLTIQGDNSTDIYLALLHNNEVVASAKAPIQYVSDDIIGTYANPTSIEFAEGSDAWSGDYNVTAIYSMDGKCLPTTDVKTLSTGLYIIKYEVLSNNDGSSSGCRVIRVVQ